MTDTSKLFQLAQLAEASYADFIDPNTGLMYVSSAKVKDALEAENFSSTQAVDFVANWQVVHHQSDTGSSYSGTLFRYIGNDPNSGFSQGELVFSQREGINNFV